jgi:DeoR/GlpR family transcriptional regulator of sugar metabolism
MNERQTKILDILNKEKRLPVTKLAEMLAVSEVTTRKDLTLLEGKGFLKREHGFAALEESDDVGRRLSVNYEAKRRIARLAMETVADGETVMIESGSTCALLAEALVTERRDITITTNSVFIANFVRDKRGVRTILLGGEFQNEAQVMVGPMVRKCAESFYVDKLFAGTDGFNERGAMSGDLMRAEAVRAMAENAKEINILTEAGKFYRTGVVSLFSYEEISSIYTDETVDQVFREVLREKGVSVHMA